MLRAFAVAFGLICATTLASSAPVGPVEPQAGSVKPCVVKLQQIGGDPAITVNGKPIPGMMMYIYPVRGDSFKLHREIGNAGVHLYADCFGTENAGDLGRTASGKYDYSVYDKYFANILAADPDAFFLPHIGVTAPAWWQKAHPEELCEFSNGRKGPSSLASLLWRQEMGDDLRKLIAHLRKAPYADRIIGYSPFSGFTGEWQTWGLWDTDRDDYSAPSMRAFREFLTKRYGADATLQKAWNDPQVTLATAAVPTPAQRSPTGTAALRDPATEQRCIDWYEFSNNMMADSLLYFAKVTREATNGEALVGTYYGYLSQHGYRQTDAGHLGVEKVFDSQYIDFLMGPPCYNYRKTGETSTLISATDSLRMRGKLWIDEADPRTYLSRKDAGFGRSDTLSDTQGVFFRELAAVLAKRAAVSYYDMEGGWYSDPDLLRIVGKANELSRQSLTGRSPFVPELCLLVDINSFYWMRPTDVVGNLVGENLVAAPQSGVPFDYCLLSDMGKPWFPDYKLYLFLNAVSLDAKTRAMIVAKLKKNNATAIFLYAPGYFLDGKGSLQNMQDLTGITLAVDETEGTTQLRFKAGEPLAAGIDVAKPVGTNMRFSPRFYGAADTNQTTLATIATAGNDLTPSTASWEPVTPGTIANANKGNNLAGKPGLVLKKNDGWTAIYSSSLRLPAALLRNLARQAGAHVYVESGDATYADNRYIGVHAATAGEKTIRLPPGSESCRVKDALTGQELTVEQGTTVRTVTLTFARGETRILNLKFEH